MTAPFTAYPDTSAARRAIEALRNAGVPRSAIRLLSGGVLHDVRAQAIGGFAGPVDPDAPVGRFAGSVLLRRQAAGTFAGDPDEQRQGSFADHDGVTIVAYDDRRERSRVTGRPGLRRYYQAAALDDAAALRARAALNSGHVIVLVAATAIAGTDTQARVERTARAA